MIDLQTSITRREVASTVFELCLDCAESQGLSADEMCKRSGLLGGRASLEGLDYLSWEVFNLLLSGMEEEKPGVDWAELIASRFLSLPMMIEPLQGLLRRVSDPAWLYVALNKGFGSSQFPCASAHVETLEPQHLRLYVLVDSPADNMSELYVKVMCKTMAKMPRVIMGLDEAECSYMIENSHESWIDIRLPSSRSVWSKLGVVGKVIKGERKLGHELDSYHQHQQDLNERLQRLNQKEEAMERRIMERTRELERLNKELTAARDKAREENRAKSAYLANMSHEIRTPLNAIIGGTEMVMEDMEDAGEANYVDDMERINQAGRHLMRLIENVLDLSKIEAGHMELVSEVMMLKTLVDEVLAPMELLARQDHTTLKLDNQSKAKVLHVDVLRLKQILTNLLSNALKFGKGKEVTFRLKDDGDAWIVFEVEDQGGGISEEAMHRVFLPFSQADDMVQKRFGGTGLGLTISYHFAELMGGVLSVESKLGEGSIFRLRLPVKSENQSE